MIKYSLPGLYTHFKLNSFVIHLLKTLPDIFFDGIEIEAVYGSFPFCIWDGGRIFCSYTHATREEIENVVYSNLDNNIKTRLIFTNNLLNVEDYTDHFGNLILSICDLPGNQVVFGDDTFKDYVKTAYKNYDFISSTTKCLNKEALIKELEKSDYSEICLDYNLNKLFNLFETLTTELKNKCEFLVNPICPAACKLRKNHYRLNSLFYLNLGKDYVVPACGITYNPLHPKGFFQLNNIDYPEIINTYEPLGFLHFKLEGRTWDDITLCCEYSLYLVKPDYREYFISLCMQHLAEGKIIR